LRSTDESVAAIGSEILIGGQGSGGVSPRGTVGVVGSGRFAGAHIIACKHLA
jgi:hypothetical protein